MYDSFTAQLAGLDLAGFSFQPAPLNETDFPAEEASEQTLAAVWSDLFALFADTALEVDAEDIAWGLVNLFHRAASRKSAQVDRASDEIRALLASADGSEVHSSNLEEQIERAQAAEASMLAFEHRVWKHDHGMGYDFSSLDLLDALPDAIEQAAHEREAEVRSTSGRKLGLPRFSGGEAPSCQIESTPHFLLFMDQWPIPGAAERVDAA